MPRVSSDQIYRKIERFIDDESAKLSSNERDSLFGRIRDLMESNLDEYESWADDDDWPDEGYEDDE